MNDTPDEPIVDADETKNEEAAPVEAAAAPAPADDMQHAGEDEPSGEGDEETAA